MPDPDDTLSRRRLLQGMAGLPALLVAMRQASATGSPAASRHRRAHGRAVVVGAGAFGGWSALALQRSGWRVTLIDAWGPGCSRSSSGGETRVIRGMYGPDAIYTEWVARSFELWQESARSWGQALYRPTGALWMFRGDDAYAERSLPYLAEHGFEVEQLEVEVAARRWPQIDLAGIRSVFFEPQAGYLTARIACRAVADVLVQEGGSYRQAQIRPPRPEQGRLNGAVTASGERIEADLFVFAAGPWLPHLFPLVVGKGVVPTRQEVFFFGTEPGPSPYDEGSMPVWIDFGERVFYGVPGNLSRGFKIADDTHGTPIDPTHLQRQPHPESLARARRQLARRFPGLARAPLLETRVCQYSNSPDGHFVIDRHPEAENLWIVGGGSGHGFKLGPAVGEHVARLAAGREKPLPRFSLTRLQEAKGTTESQLSRGTAESAAERP